eukprot:ANDGO_03170.mRNA.1 hypothetical protein
MRNIQNSSPGDVHSTARFDAGSLPRLVADALEALEVLSRSRPDTRSVYSEDDYQDWMCACLLSSQALLGAIELNAGAAVEEMFERFAVDRGSHSKNTSGSTFLQERERLRRLFVHFIDGILQCWSELHECVMRSALEVVSSRRTCLSEEEFTSSPEPLLFPRLSRVLMMSLKAYSAEPSKISHSDILSCVRRWIHEAKNWNCPGCGDHDAPLYFEAVDDASQAFWESYWKLVHELCLHTNCCFRLRLLFASLATRIEIRNGAMPASAAVDVSERSFHAPHWSLRSSEASQSNITMHDPSAGHRDTRSCNEVVDFSQSQAPKQTAAPMTLATSSPDSSRSHALASPIQLQDAQSSFCSRPPSAHQHASQASCFTTPLHESREKSAMRTPRSAIVKRLVFSPNSTVADHPARDAAMHMNAPDVQSAIADAQDPLTSPSFAIRRWRKSDASKMSLNLSSISAGPLDGQLPSILTLPVYSDDREFPCLTFSEAEKHSAFPLRSIVPSSWRFAALSVAVAAVLGVAVLIGRRRGAV